MGYDQNYRLTDINASGQYTVASLAYQYNLVSNISSKLDSVGPDSQSFNNDELDRLFGTDGIFGHIEYSYDAVGSQLNRTTVKAGCHGSDL